VRHHDGARRAVLLAKVHAAPVAHPRHGEPRDVGERVVVVERGRQDSARLGEEPLRLRRFALLGDVLHDVDREDRLAVGVEDGQGLDAHPAAGLGAALRPELGERRLRRGVAGERLVARQLLDGEWVPLGVRELEAGDDLGERRGKQLLERVEPERVDRRLVGEHEVVRPALRGDGVGHSVEDRLELVARAPEVGLDRAQLLVEARVVRRGGHAIGQLAGERQVGLVIHAARLGRRDRHRPERPPVRAERDHQSRSHLQRLEQAEVVLIGGDRRQKTLVHLAVEPRLAVAHHRGGTLGPVPVERVAPQQLPGEALTFRVAVHRGDLACSLLILAEEHEAPVAQLAGQDPRDLDHHQLGVQGAVDHVAHVRDQRVAPPHDSLALAGAGDPDRDRAADHHARDASEVLVELQEDPVDRADREGEHEGVRGDQRGRPGRRAERGQQRAGYEDPDEEGIAARDRVDDADDGRNGEADDRPDELEAALPRPPGHSRRSRARVAIPRAIGRGHLLLSAPCCVCESCRPVGRRLTLTQRAPAPGA
jgi:hypothetical protein